MFVKYLGGDVVYAFFVGGGLGGDRIFNFYRFFGYGGYCDYFYIYVCYLY